MKLRQLWCWLRHGFDHAGVSIIELIPGRKHYRCKKCGYVGEL